MAEPVGLALGVLGLAGLFSTVIDVWDFVDAGRGYAEEFSYLKTRLDNQREILVQWGRRMDFGNENGHNPRLDEPRIRPRIEASLQHIELIFSNTEDLVTKYGIRIEERNVNGVIKQTGSVQIWKSSFDRFRSTLRQTQKAASTFKVTRWSIRDGGKFEKMVDCVAKLLSDLNEMTRDFVSQQRHEEIAMEEAETIHDVQQLAQVQQAIPVSAGYAETIISSAASIRQRLLKRRDAQTINTLISSVSPYDDEAQSVAALSADTSFHTARTHHSGAMNERIQELQVRPTDGTSDKCSLPALIEVNLTAIAATVNMFREVPSRRFLLEPERSEIEHLAGAPSGSFHAVHRILKETRDALYQATSNKTESPADTFVTWAPIRDQNMFEILGSIRGPLDTPYDGGIFHIRINIGCNPDSHYPFKPPICWFLTKIFHPNIDEKGAICMDILKDQWSPGLTVETVLYSILSLLADPNPEDPVFTEAAILYKSDRGSYDRKVREWTSLYATGEIIHPGTRADGFANTTG